MLLFPLVMNIVQAWLIDMVIKARVQETDQSNSEYTHVFDADLDGNFDSDGSLGITPRFGRGLFASIVDGSRDSSPSRKDKNIKSGSPGKKGKKSEESGSMDDLMDGKQH